MARRKKGEPEDGRELPPPADGGERDRRLRTPPPLMEGNEPFEGGEILDELDGELGALLWNSLRSVTLWARATPSRRGQMAAPDAAARRAEELARVAMPEAVAGPLATLARVLSEPASVESSGIAAACRAVAEWANAQGMLGTALAFLQAAALARPDDANLSYAVGRMARRHGEPTRAESWLQYAIAQARRNNDWEVYTLVYAGLGNLYAERGNLPAGKRALIRALRSAQRHGFRRLEGETLHDLFGVSAAGGNLREAEQYAAETLKVYGPGHRRLPYLAQDLAFFWVERGLHGPALAIVRKLRPLIQGFPERMLLLSNMARAAGAESERAEFEDAMRETLHEVPPVPTREGVAAALLNLGYGAEAIGEVPRAREMAERASSVAAKTKEGKMRLLAEALLTRLEEEGKAGAAPAKVAARTYERSLGLAEAFVGALAAQAG
jgi:tetratricopeptide (TPR) repeat protein